MNKIDKSLPVIERWKKEGYLDYVKEDKQKYLSDLYDALYDKIMSMNIQEKVLLADRLKLEILGVLDRDGDWEVNLNDALLELLLPVLRRVYEVNNTVSIIEFENCLRSIDIDNWFLNDNLNGYNSSGKLIGTYERLTNHIIEKLNDCISEEY